MENDKQITNLQLEKVKQSFLNDDLLTKNSKPKVYSLQDEFSKSKHNKSIFVYALILLYTTLIGIGVYFLTSIEEQKSKRVEVNIAEFRQFNLMELLEQKKESEQKLAKLQGELEKVRADSLRQIQKLTPEAQRNAMAALNEKLKKLETEYQNEVKSSQKALKSLQKTVVSEKKRTEKAARETEKLSQDFQQLKQKKADDVGKITKHYETKIAKLTKDFESDFERQVLRYNPVFSEGEIAVILNTDFNVNTKGSSWSKYSKTLLNEGIISEQEAGDLRQKVHNQKIIIDSLQEIEYTNSIPPILEKLEKISLSIISDYEAICGKLVNRVAQKNNNSDSIIYALNYLIKSNSVDGYVLDARTASRLIVYINNEVPVNKGDIAQIFKKDAPTPFAEIELNPEGDKITGKVKKRVKSIKIEPFDYVLLENKKE